MTRIISVGICTYMDVSLYMVPLKTT